jgi:hypothetical protein
MHGDYRIKWCIYIFVLVQLSNLLYLADTTQIIFSRLTLTQNSDIRLYLHSLSDLNSTDWLTHVCYWTLIFMHSCKQCVTLFSKLRMFWIFWYITPAILLSVITERLSVEVKCAYTHIHYKRNRYLDMIPSGGNPHCLVSTSHGGMNEQLLCEIRWNGICRSRGLGIQERDK